jgi:hypothetical protein
MVEIIPKNDLKVTVVKSPLLKYNQNLPRGKDNELILPSPVIRYRAHLMAKKSPHAPMKLKDAKNFAKKPRFSINLK